MLGVSIALMAQLMLYFEVVVLGYSVVVNS
jgi:hypothetical protein